MVPPALIHMYADNFWLAIGRAMRRIEYLDDVIVEHLHPAAGKSEMDASYQVSGPYMRPDALAFSKYLDADFPKDVRKLRDLIDCP